MFEINTQSIKTVDRTLELSGNIKNPGKIKNRLRIFQGHFGIILKNCKPQVSDLCNSYLKKKTVYLKKNYPNMLSNTSLDFISDMGVTDHNYYDR